MGKFENDAKELLNYVGGKENIKAVTHCVTRMRFVLAQPQKAEIKKIEALSSVKGTFTQSGQFQVIIGNEVSNFYNEFTTIAGIEGVNKETVKNAAKSNQTLLQRIMGSLAEIFAPLIPALICGGMILGFRSIIGDIAFMESGTKTLIEVSQFWAGIHSFLWLIGEAIFHFLPVGIVWSITKKMGTTQILGIVLGLTLVSPQLLNAYSMAPDAVPPVWNFGFAQIQMVGYQAQVIPAMLAGFILVYLEKFFRKITPEYISMIIVPLLSLIPAVLAAHIIVGPIGWAIGSWISGIVYTALTSSFRLLFAGIFGLLYAPLVITGLHHMSNAIDLQLMSEFGGTMLWPMIALSNIAQGSAVLAMILLQKKDEKAKQVNIPSCISCYLGVTEPALFGVNLKYGFPFVCGLIGSGIAAIISVGAGVMSSSIGVGGIPGILSIFPQYMGMFAVAMLVAIIVPFSLTMVVGKKKLAVENTQEIEKNNNSEIIETVSEKMIMPMTGTLLPLSEIEDKAFASGAMGDGFAVDLKDSIVIAPFSGEIVAVFPTKHAYGLQTLDGKEILIHLGMDTVELNGEGFESFVEMGDKVKQGDKIAKVNLDFVRSKNKSLVSPVIITTGEKLKMEKQNQSVVYGEKNMISIL